MKKNLLGLYKHDIKLQVIKQITNQNKNNKTQLRPELKNKDFNVRFKTK